jgi:hypothetical protein
VGHSRLVLWSPRLRGSAPIKLFQPKSTQLDCCSCWCWKRCDRSPSSWPSGRANECVSKKLLDIYIQTFAAAVLQVAQFVLVGAVAFLVQMLGVYEIYQRGYVKRLTPITTSMLVASVGCSFGVAWSVLTLMMMYHPGDPGYSQR